MARFGIVSKKVFGLSSPMIKALAKKVKKNHELAIELWETGIYESRILAGLIADPQKMNRELTDKWVNDFDNWAICDNTCSNIFDKINFRDEKIFEWAENDKEFVRRAAFATIAYNAVHDKKRDDDEFIMYFPLIKTYAIDNRNFVKKAVNWAIRQMGKRSRYLNSICLELCEELLKLYPSDKTVKWITTDAIRELTDEKILARLKR